MGAVEHVTPGAAVAGVAAAPGEVGRGPDRYISLRQPWASLWVAGAKMIETRSWPTKFRGRLAVHASKTFGREEVDACNRHPFCRVLDQLGFTPSAETLPRGAVIGWVTITDCLLMAEFPHGHQIAGQIAIHPDRSDPRITEDEREFGAYAPGRYAWVADSLRFVLDEPIQMRALQRIQRLPAGIAARLSL